MRTTFKFRRLGLILTGVVSLLILFAGALFVWNKNIANSQEPPKKRIAVVLSGSSGVDYIINYLKVNYDVFTLTFSQLKTGVPSGTDVLIFPGGTNILNEISYTSPPAFNQAMQTSINTFVKNGGGFIGICGGSIIGSDRLQTKSGGISIYVDAADLLKTDAVDYIDWFTNYRGGGKYDSQSPDALRFTNHAVAGTYANQTQNVDYYGGPVFTNYSGLEVVAYYTQPLLSPNYNTTGKPAIVAGQLGSGKVVLSAHHPEYKTGTRFLLDNMVRWVSTR